MPWALLELPEKQEQLAAIYTVLEHLPEANHNSLERLIFHLVKQVSTTHSLWGGAPRSTLLFCTRPQTHAGGSGRGPAPPWCLSALWK